MRTLLVLFLLPVLLGIQAVRAGDVPAPLQTVEIKGARTRLVPYADLFYPMAKAVQDTLGGRAALAVQLRATRQDVHTEDVEIWLQGEHESLPVPRQVDGVFVVPVVEQIAHEKGQFLINKRKEDLSVNLVLVPLVPRTGWTIGAVRQLLGDARGSVGKLLPWYQKPVIWAVTRKLAVAVCSHMRDAQVVLRDGEQVVAKLPAREEMRNYARETVFCRRFDGTEAYSPATQLVIPDEAEVLLL